jgi:hypothetical protein
MKLKNINTIYCNGSSLSAGGGLYNTDVKEIYKNSHGVEWNNEKDVTYSKYIADYFSCKLVHDAQCGSGAPRLIRRTYEYIQKIGIENAKKTLFLFEITDPIHRIDMFCREINDYIIVNVRYDDDSDGSISNLSVQYSYSPNDNPYPDNFFKGKIESDVLRYIDNFHDPIVYSNRFKGDLIGLFTFLDKLGIQYFYMFDNPGGLKYPFDEVYEDLDSKHQLIIEDNVYTTSHFCHKHKLTIKDETRGYTDDTHPGYFGYKKFSEIAIDFIKSRLETTFSKNDELI